MQNIQKQISRLYLSTVFGYLSLSGAWIAILAARGYSLVEIGFAETVFHITSLILEIPSGVFADVFGKFLCPAYFVVPFVLAEAYGKGLVNICNGCNVA